MNNILDLDYLDAHKYFLRSKSYCNIDLPQYFSFQELLETVSNNLSNKDIAQIISPQLKPFELDDINYSFLKNKNDSLSWCPLKIIHPVYYIHIVNIITQKNNWDYIISRFKDFQKNKNIICYSYPISVNELLTKEKNLEITNWWANIEQQSLQLALEYSKYGTYRHYKLLWLNLYTCCCLGITQ